MPYKDVDCKAVSTSAASRSHGLRASSSGRSPTFPDRDAERRHTQLRGAGRLEKELVQRRMLALIDVRLVFKELTASWQIAA